MESARYQTKSSNLVFSRKTNFLKKLSLTTTVILSLNYTEFLSFLLGVIGQVVACTSKLAIFPFPFFLVLYPDSELSMTLYLE